MAIVAAAPQRLTIGQPPGSSLGALRWLSPVLIGLCAPMVAGLVLFPGLIEHAKFAISVVLTALVVISVVAYALTVLNPGPVTGLVIDRSDRTVMLTREGLFASSTRGIAFEEVADFRMSETYDADGYALDGVELKTRAGEVLALQIELSADEITAARRTMGLATGRR